MRISVLILAIVAAFNTAPSAQNYLEFRSVGLNFTKGVINELLPEDYRYHSNIISGRYSLGLLRNPRIVNLTVAILPQFGIASSPSQTLIEAGVNVNFQLSWLPFEKQIIYAGVGSGPHYTNLMSDLQARGFIFSDNFILGTRRIFRRPGLDFELLFEIGYRHNSNAGIKSPNGGIDTAILTTGFSILLDRKKKRPSHVRKAS